MKVGNVLHTCIALAVFSLISLVVHASERNLIGLSVDVPETFATFKHAHAETVLLKGPEGEIFNITLLRQIVASEAELKPGALLANITSDMRNAAARYESGKGVYRYEEVDVESRGKLLLLGYETGMYKTPHTRLEFHLLEHEEPRHWVRGSVEWKGDLKSRFDEFKDRLRKIEVK